MAEAQQRVGEFYAEVVLPALAARLDAAFPEFGWRPDARGWVASNQEMTHRVLGVRADRVVAHGDAPPGFLVHGGESVLWTAYVNGGEVPRGDTFRSVVRELAERAGVDASADRAGPATRSPQRASQRLLQAVPRRTARAGGRSRSRVPPEPRLPRRGDRPTSTWGSSLLSCSRRTPSKRRLLRARDRAVRRARGRPLAREALRRLARRARTNRNVLGAVASRLRFLDALPLPSRSKPLGAPALRAVRCSSPPGRRPTRGRACRGSDRRASPPRARLPERSPRSAAPRIRLGAHPARRGTASSRSCSHSTTTRAGRDGAARAVEDVSRADRAPALRVARARAARGCQGSRRLRA